MKTIIISFLVLVSFICSCEKTVKDPCQGVLCNGNLGVSNFCHDGICTCDQDKFGVIRWAAKCINCSASSTITVDLVINNNKVGSLNLSTYTPSLNIKGFDLGSKPYKVVSGSKVLESGQILITQCEQLYLYTQITK